MVIEYVDIHPRKGRTPKAGKPEPAQEPCTPEPLDAAAYGTALKRLGLSHAQAASLFGFSRQASNQWANGTAAIPPYVGRFVRVALAVGQKELERLMSANLG